MKKILTIIALSVLWSNVVLANCVGNCSNGYGTYTWPDGYHYVDEFKDDNIHGQGTYTWKDGAKYSGEVRNGVQHGRGTYSWSDGKHYIGEFKLGKAHGKGTLNYPNGDRYIGQYRNNKKHGHGTFTWGSDGEYQGRQVKQTDRFVGEFAGDFPKGEGIYYHADGRIEEGHWDGFELVQEKKISKQKPQ